MPSCTCECGAAPNLSSPKGPAAEPGDPWHLPPHHHQPCHTHMTPPSPNPPACPAYHHHEGGQHLSQAFPHQLVPDAEQTLGSCQERSGAHSASWAEAAVAALAVLRVV